MKTHINIIQCPSGRYTLAGFRIPALPEICRPKKNHLGQDVIAPKVWETAELALSDCLSAGFLREDISIHHNPKE